MEPILHAGLNAEAANFANGTAEDAWVFAS